MLKKLTLILLIVAPFVMQSGAQCVPDTAFKTSGIYPDTVENLPPAIATVYYQGVITFVVPVDTNLGGFIVPIDSIGVIGVTGLPAGFNYFPNTPSGYWLGGDSGCVMIAGLPMQSQVGTHPFTVSVMGKAGGLSVPATVMGYKIVIKDSSYASIPDVQAGKGLYTYPNPADMSLRVLIQKELPSDAFLLVFNQLGQVIDKVNVPRGTSILDLNTGNYAEGAYMLRLAGVDGQLSRTFIIKH